MRNITFYFPPKTKDGLRFPLLFCKLFLLNRGYDWGRFRIQFDGHRYNAEAQGNEQHERTTNPAD